MSFRVSFCSCVFSPFSTAITSLGEERANLGAFGTCVRFVLVWICRFPLPLGVWEGLRFVIVALPGLFSYLFWLVVRTPVLSFANPSIGKIYNLFRYRKCLDMHVYINCIAAMNTSHFEKTRAILWRPS